MKVREFGWVLLPLLLMYWIFSTQAESVTIRTLTYPLNLTATSNDTALVLDDSLIVKSGARMRNVYVDSLYRYGIFSSAPVACSATYEGAHYYNSSDNKVYLCNGSAWVVAGITPPSAPPTAAQILASKDCYDEETQIVGTMVDRGAQQSTPTTSNITINTGYHDGLGYCAGDADMVAANIKSGVTINTVAGSLAPAGTAVAADAISGKTFYSGNSWSQKTGTMTNNGAWEGNATSANVTIPAGYHSGGFCTGDAALVAGNIASGVNIKGVTGNMALITTSCTGSGIANKKCGGHWTGYFLPEQSGVTTCKNLCSLVRQAGKDNAHLRVSAGVAPDGSFSQTDCWDYRVMSGFYRCNCTDANGSFPTETSTWYGTCSG